MLYLYNSDHFLEIVAADSVHYLLEEVHVVVQVECQIKLWLERNPVQVVFTFGMEQYLLAQK